jgi:catechol 2,3-dioxygenase-like lactoylglutathione lyase family enzyme
MFREFRSLATVLAASISILCATMASAQAPDAPAPADVTLSAVALNVADLARSEKFYIDVLGLERTFRYPADGKLLEVGLSRPGQKGQMSVILAHFNDDPLPEEKARYGRIVVVTTDARAVAKRATDAGFAARTLSSPPGGSVVIFVTDPDGYQVELYQPAPQPAATGS